jgi:hypothetical protein
MAEKAKQLDDYIDSVIKHLTKIKMDLDKEIQNEYCNLASIAWQMEVYSIGGIRRRRGKDSVSEDE